MIQATSIADTSIKIWKASSDIDMNGHVLKADHITESTAAVRSLA